MLQKTKEILDNPLCHLEYEYSYSQILIIACGITVPPKKVRVINTETSELIEIIYDKNILKELP